MSTCKEPECYRTSHTDGYCPTHYAWALEESPELAELAELRAKLAQVEGESDTYRMAADQWHAEHDRAWTQISDMGEELAELRTRTGHAEASLGLIVSTIHSADSLESLRRDAEAAGWYAQPPKQGAGDREGVCDGE